MNYIVRKKMKKTHCVKCKCKLSGNEKDYLERGNWCAWCDAKATVTKKPDISFFIRLAKSV